VLREIVLFQSKIKHQSMFLGYLWSFLHPVLILTILYITGLAFSITRYFSTDINLVDEALSAGDQRFKEKCEAVFESHRSSEKTFIFARHRMPFDKKIFLQSPLAPSRKTDDVR